MSFFTKWFKKFTEEDEETTVSGTSTSQDAGERIASPSSGRDQEWRVIPEHRADTVTLTRYILLKNAQEPQLDSVLPKLRLQGVDAEGGVANGQVIVHYRGMTATAEYVPSPLPNQEAEENSRYNRLWPTAEQEISGYAAQMVVTLRNAPNGLSGHRFLTQTIAALLDGELNTLAVYSAPLLISRADYLASAELLQEQQEVPVNLWVFVGLYRSASSGAAYTHGMVDFGLDELELLNSQRSDQEVLEVMFAVVHRMVSRNMKVAGGETMQLGAERELKLLKSAGVALEGVTVKVEEG
ncbi:DUF4261 domain-containing protein [Saccharibacillus sp. JS10]|uniref:DUF4261 domain-containing protein n=1 Tax=Saccharibacillus sp. JS10 TaxID=2950552 RepID=UPI00210923D5|nr:DUF4261 domain-containing protein [Saccharibacillus sp. JS10]MCQ4085965.1 DUF4261 domain-containing protein [Saccharibacillus sp. JS10]